MISFNNPYHIFLNTTKKIWYKDYRQIRTIKTFFNFKVECTLLVEVKYSCPQLVQTGLTKLHLYVLGTYIFVIKYLLEHNLSIQINYLLLMSE